MSRILRRPMFRGGPVDSRGTGITSGLDKPKRGLVNEPGGYAGEKSGMDFLKSALNKYVLGERFTNPNYVSPMKFQSGTGFGFMTPENQAPGLIKIGEGISKRDPRMDELGIDEYAKKVKYSPGMEKFMDESDIEVGEGDLNLSDKEKSELKDFYKSLDIKGDLDYKGGEPDKIEKPVQEVSFSDSADGDVTTVDENDLDSLIDRYYKQLGGDKARQEYVGDALAAASEKFFEGDMKGALVAAAKTKSKEPEIKRAAAMLGIRGEQAQKLYETKLKNQSGQLQKAVEYIKAINPGMSDKEALATYQRRPRSLSETVGKYKQQDGVIMPSGITLAAGEWFLDDYKGELPTDGNIKEGDKAAGKGDGAYTDKAKGLIFVIKDEVVTDVSKFEN